MIHYHGLPITPTVAAAEVLRGRHAFISYAHPEQIGLAAELCQSYALDNGAFSAWRGGSPITDWAPYYRWAKALQQHPGCDFAVIPDVIDGSEEANDALLEEWPLGTFGVPVYHLHESLDRLARLVSAWPRVALGSSGQWGKPNTGQWWMRMAEVMRVGCDGNGLPRTKLHGLRMLNPRVFTRLPLASADSTNVARNIGIDQAWKGPYQPPNKAVRALVLTARIECQNGAAYWQEEIGDDSSE